MNPSYMASMRAASTMMLNLFLGIPHVPKTKKETSINGRAFAPGKGVQQEASSDEKEAKVQAHLAKLRNDVRTRAGIGKVYGKPGVDPVSPKVRKAIDDAYQYRVGQEDNARAADLLDKTTVAFKTAQAKRGPPHWLPNAKIDERSTHEQTLEALHRTHAAYIERRIKLNREEAAEKAIPIWPAGSYPISDLIELRDEEQERRKRIAACVVHTGERINTEE